MRKRYILMEQFYAPSNSTGIIGNISELPEVHLPVVFLPVLSEKNIKIAKNPLPVNFLNYLSIQKPLK